MAQGTLSNISASTHRNTDLGLSALGRSYENKKQKLMLELQMDYKAYLAKKTDFKSRVRDRQHKDLPIHNEEKAPTKVAVANVRKFESMHGLAKQSEPEESDAVTITSPYPALSFLNTSTRTTECLKECPVTPTKPGDDRARCPDILSCGPQRRRRWQIPPQKNSSEDELITDEEDFDSRLRGRRDKSSYEQKYKEKQGTPQPRGKRALQNIREMQALTIQNKNDSDVIWKEVETPQHMKTPARFTPASDTKEKTFATGLMTGAVEERSVTQMKKEQYKQELLRQIEEQRKNKIKDQRARMNIGATETPAPRKEPECKRESCTASKKHENLKQDVFDTKEFDPKCGNLFQSQQHRNLGENPLVSLNQGTVQPVPPFDYYSGSPAMQGQAAFPRLTVVPPVAHTISDAGIVSVLGGAQLENETSAARLLPVGLISDSPLDIDGRPADSSRRRNESTLSYREALRKQITEKEENVRREKEKKRRDAAELLDEMAVYDPWGKGGAGAPIKDKHGNIVCDLNRMHRINNNRRTSLRDETGAPISQQDLGHQSPLQQESYREQLKQQIEQNKRKKEEEQERIRIAEEKEEMERARIRQQYEDEKRRENEMRQNQNKLRYQNESHDTKTPESKPSAPGDLNQMHRINNNRRTSLRDETGAPISQQGFCISALSNFVGHQSPLQQESYREQLKQQIEQNKRKKEEEREHIRIAEEKEEMERVRIRQQYEDEKRRENEMRQNQNKLRYQNESHDTKEAISNGQTKQTLPESAFLNADTSRLSPVDRVVSPPNTQPLPESKPSVPGDKQEVIRELSVFRKLLRKKQRELEFEMAWRRTVHSNLNKY